MAAEKRNSHFEPKSFPESENDLEQYGVWVKVPPEEVEENILIENEEEFELRDLDADEENSFDTTITAEEEELLGTLEHDYSEESFDIDLDFEDSDTPDETLSSDNDDTLSIDNIEDINIDLQNLNSSEEDVDFSENSEIFSVTEEVTEEDMIPDEDSLYIEEEIDEIDLSDLQESDINEVLPELDIEEPSDKLEESFEEESTEGEDLIFEDLTDLDDDRMEESDGFDDLTALEEDLRDVSEEADEAVTEAYSSIPEKRDPQPQSSFTSDPSMSILQKIETELSAIKAELFDLKKELGSLKSVKDDILKEISTEESDDQHIKEASGFFDDDDDETIALTGDELDNILNTADITEETDGDQVVPDKEEDDILFGTKEDTPSSDLLLDKDDIISDLSLESDSSEPAENKNQEELPELEEEIEVLIPDSDDDFPEEVGTISEEIDFDDQEPMETMDLSFLEDEDLEDKEDGTEDIPGSKNLSSEDEFDLSAELDDIDDFPEKPAEPTESMAIDIELPEMQEEPEEETLDFDFFDENADTEPGNEEDFSGTTFSDSDIQDAKKVDFLEEPYNEEDLELEELEEIEVEKPETVEEREEILSVAEDEYKSEDISEHNLDEEPDQIENLDDDSDSEWVSQDNIPESQQKETLSEDLKQEIRSVLSYMDQLLESLPEEKIEEFANSEHFDVYKHLFDELGLNS